MQYGGSAITAVKQLQYNFSAPAADVYVNHAKVAFSFVSRCVS